MPDPACGGVLEEFDPDLSRHEVEKAQRAAAAEFLASLIGCNEVDASENEIREAKGAKEQKQFGAAIRDAMRDRFDKADKFFMKQALNDAKTRGLIENDPTGVGATARRIPRQRVNEHVRGHDDDVPF